MKKKLSVLAVSCLCGLFARPVFAADGYLGKIEKFELGGITVHAYNSAEGMLDGSAIFETDKALVLLEPQSMPESAADLKKYAAGLRKPLEAIVVSYHGAGLSSYPGIPIYASRAAVEFAKSGGEAKLFEYFASSVPGFDATVVVPDRVLDEKSADIAGVEFALTYHDAPAPAPGMTVAIPSAKVVYLHMLGGDSHSILVGKEQIDAFIEELKNLKAQNYALILTSHHAPEKPEALDKKIAYLEKTKEIVDASKTKDEFVSAMKKTFPDYRGEAYLEMSADSLYK